MEYKFSDRVLTLKPSAIREIFKYAADPSYISLSAGNPAPEAFPSKQLAAISAKLMEEEPILALQYSTTEGYPPLLQHLKAYMKSSRNIGTEDDVLSNMRSSEPDASPVLTNCKQSGLNSPVFFSASQMG